MIMIPKRYSLVSVLSVMILGTCIVNLSVVTWSDENSRVVDVVNNGPRQARLVSAADRQQKAQEEEGQALSMLATAAKSDILSFFNCHHTDRSQQQVIRSATDLFCAVATHAANNTALHTCRKASRETLLTTWTRLRQTVADEALLKMALQAASPMTRTIASHHHLTLWVPKMDQGVTQVISELNRREYGSFLSLLSSRTTQRSSNNTSRTTSTSPATSRHPVFVDAGSNLGFVTLLTALETNAEIVSIEAASPTWVMQQLNMVCNLPAARLPTVHSIFAALGSTADEGSTLQLSWRPTSTITVRGWDNEAPRQRAHQAFDFFVPVRTLRSVLADALADPVQPFQIEVCKIDCEGCEYNVVPDLQQDELDAMDTIIGEIHFGFIPTERAPSKARTEITHRRLCQHANFVQFAKECCQFPDQIVKHLNLSFRETNWYQGLCHDFAQWSANNHLVQDRDDETAWKNIGKVQQEPPPPQQEEQVKQKTKSLVTTSRGSSQLTANEISIHRIIFFTFY